MRRKIFRLLIAVLALSSFAVTIGTGCKKKEAAPNDQTSAQAQREAPAEQVPAVKPDFPELTSIQAAQLADQEARKWNPDALLWYLTCPSKYLDYRYAENDRAWQWAAVFVNPHNDRRYNVQIQGDRAISGEEEKYVKRESPVDPGFPKDRPGVSLKDAVKVALEAGAPGWEKPMFYYIIDNSNPAYHGKPVWDLVFSSQMVAYTVDGISGKLLETRLLDLAGSRPITPEEIQKLPLGKDENQARDLEIIYQFYQAINEGKYDDALAMMNPETAGNDQTRQIWKNNFDSLDRVKVIDVTAAEQTPGGNERPVYQVLIYARLKNPGQSRNWADGENSRWITISPSGEGRKIFAIATSPLK